MNSVDASIIKCLVSISRFVSQFMSVIIAVYRYISMIIRIPVAQYLRSSKCLPTGAYFLYSLIVLVKFKLSSNAGLFYIATSRTAFDNAPERMSLSCNLKYLWISAKLNITCYFTWWVILLEVNQFSPVEQKSWNQTSFCFVLKWGLFLYLKIVETIFQIYFRAFGPFLVLF